MTLISKIEDRTALIGIIGLGYVGTPLALRFSECGFGVLGFDVNAPRVDGFNNGISPIGHIPDTQIAAMRQRGFEATTDYARAAEPDVLIICVPTPLGVHREPDMSFVTNTIAAAAPYLRAGQVMSLESTVFPGATEETIAPVIRAAGLEIGRDYHLVFSPEREDPGNAGFSTATIPKVVGGMTPDCLAVGQALYSAVVDQIVPVSSTQVAEMVKLLENIYRSVNIGLVNEMKVLADRMGVDIFEIIKAAATKPFGFTPFYPGPGVGGHCIPIDPFYLTWKAREYGLHTRFIELAGEINASMPGYVVDRLFRALNERSVSIRGAKILVLGIAYKPDIGDPRESPSVLVMEQLRDLGAVLSYSDPHVPHFPQMRAHAFDLSSVPLTPEVLSAQDAVVLLTAHRDFDYAMIGAHAPLIIDTRGKFARGGGVVSA